MAASDGIVYRVFLKGADTPIDVDVQSRYGIWRHRGLGSRAVKIRGDNLAIQEDLAFGSNTINWTDPARPDNITAPGVATLPSTFSSYIPLPNVAAVLPRNIYDRHGTTVTGSAYRIFIKGHRGHFDILATTYGIVNKLECIEVNAQGAPKGRLIKVMRSVRFLGYGGEDDPALGYTANRSYRIATATAAEIEPGAVYLPLDSVAAIIKLTPQLPGSYPYDPDPNVVGGDDPAFDAPTVQGLPFSPL